MPTPSLHAIGEYVHMLVFLLAAGALVVGGLVIAVYLARASFRGPGTVPGVNAPAAGEVAHQ